MAAEMRLKEGHLEATGDLKRESLGSKYGSEHLYKDKWTSYNDIACITNIAMSCTCTCVTVCDNSNSSRSFAPSATRPHERVCAMRAYNSCSRHGLGVGAKSIVGQCLLFRRRFVEIHPQNRS